VDNLTPEREPSFPTSQISRRLGEHPCQSEHFGIENNSRERALIPNFPN